jgi:hypothetical protein
MDRECKTCGETKPLEKFGYVYNKRADGSRVKSHRRQCRRCEHERYAEYRVADVRARQFRQKYGITIAEYDAMVAAQGGVCKICGQDDGDRRLAVVHCHATGRVRGLLCSNHNRGLGLFGDDPDLLRAAADYLTA